jgi:hypothetical protein
MPDILFIDSVTLIHSNIEIFHPTKYAVPRAPIVIMLPVKGTVVPLQAWTGPEGSSSLRLPDFKKIGT